MRDAARSGKVPGPPRHEGIDVGLPVEVVLLLGIRGDADASHSAPMRVQSLDQVNHLDGGKSGWLAWSSLVRPFRSAFLAGKDDFFANPG